MQLRTSIILLREVLADAEAAAGRGTMHGGWKHLLDYTGKYTKFNYYSSSIKFSSFLKPTKFSNKVKEK